MPANEFEKQVQKKLGELRLDPSSPVWEKIEKEIRKKKRRRIIFFFILPAALALLGYSIYHFANGHTTITLAQQHINVSPITPKQEAEKENPVQQTPSQKTEIVNNDKKITKQNPQVVQQSDEQIVVNAPSVNSGKKKSKTKNKHRNDIQKITKDNSLVIETTTPGTWQVTKPAGEEENKTGEMVIKPILSLQETQQTATIVQQPDNSLSKKDSVISKPETPGKKIAGSKKNNKNRIKWGIDFSAGITYNQEHLFSLSQGRSYDAIGINAGPATGAGSPGIIFPPSIIKPGISFRIGMMGEIKLSKRSHISAALQYKYASNRIKAGAELDTVLPIRASGSYTTQVNRIYRGAQQDNYTNSYHFVALPIGYHWQVNKSKKIQLQWDLGVTFNYLLATNALIYSASNGGIYYHDKAAINKTHFDIATGLSFRFAGKKGNEWMIGPEISFDTRNLINNGSDTRQYLLYGGIHTRILFPQKKK